MRSTNLRALALALVAAVTLAACGGGSSPTSASSFGGARGVTLSGTVLGGASSSSGSSGAAFGSGASLASMAGVLTVSVRENPAITATVAADGVFTLRGLPDGQFTLVFSLDGVEIAALTFSGVLPNQEITITVSLSGSSLSLVEEQRNGIGHGDIEVEGTVDAILTVNPTGESRFIVRSRTIVVRPGETSIREGNRSRSVTDLVLGRQVHVKGVWLPAEPSGQPVLAHEIKLQGSQGGSEPPPSASACPTGPNAQVEGKIASKGASSIVVNQTGKGNFTCEVSGSTTIRKGNKTYTFAELQPGWRVHVSGQGLGGSPGACRVAADEIKVQN